MLAVTESLVRPGRPVKVEAVGILEVALVPVGRGEDQLHDVAGRDRHARDRYILARLPFYGADRRYPAQAFVYGQRHQVGW